MWQGSIATVPDAWALCDGNNGTPNLRDRFLRASGAADNPGDTGGTPQHDHTLTTDAHIHAIPTNAHVVKIGIPPGPNGGFLSPESDTATTSAENQLPPYYNIAYIMYLGP